MRQGSSEGSAIIVFDEGVSLTEALKSMDFTGTGVTVTEGADGVITIDIPSGGAGSGTGWAGTVANFAALPAAGDHSGEVYRVTTSSGLFWAHRKGFYDSNGTVWTRQSDPTFTVLDDEATIYDDADNTKAMKFQVSTAPTSTTILVSCPTENTALQDVNTNNDHRTGDGSDYSDDTLNHGYESFASSETAVNMTSTMSDNS